MDAQDVCQLVATGLMAVAVIFSAVTVYLSRCQVQHAADAVHAMVQQTVTDRMGRIVHFFAEHPDVGKRVFSGFRGLDKDRVQEFMSVHPFLLHFEGVLSLQELLPRGDFRFYHTSMKQIFQQAPVLHEWMKRTQAAWSKELRAIAEENQPETRPEEALE